MDFFETIEKRKSVRAFLDREIDDKTLNALLGTASLAPSAGNLQAYRIVIVKGQQVKEALASAALGQMFVAKAPIAFVFLADGARSSSEYGNRGASLYSVQDATIAAAYAQLAATALGLASVWVGAFDEGTVAKLVNAKEYEKPVAIIPIGYAAEEPTRHGRRKISEIAKEI